MNNQLVPNNFFETAEIFNRLGQYYYRIGDIARAKIFFFLSNVFYGNIKLPSQTAPVGA